MRSSGSDIAASLVLASLVGFSAAGRATVKLSTSSSYEQFHRTHRKARGQDTVSYDVRKAVFEARKAEVLAHNAKKLSWTLTLNHFADYTADELQSTHGYKRVGGRWDRSSGESSFLQTGGDGIDMGSDLGTGAGSIDVSSLAKHVDWRDKMNVSNFVHNQGACGSCWAHAAVAALEAHAEITNGMQSQLSTQEIIDCSANPRHCGGTGGCQGATAEIAFEHARKHGIASLASYKAGGCAQDPPSALQVSGFVRLPENKASHLTHALATQGPVVMSIDANSLHLYNSGVFSGCEANAIVNHAVLGVGYGVDKKSGKGYWNIKNSWGDSWGEKGYFRVEKQDDDAWMSGTDNKPQDGVFCEKHPDSVPVAGMCGVTSDSAYPVISPSAAKANLRPTAANAKLSKVKLNSVL